MKHHSMLASLVALISGVALALTPGIAVADPQPWPSAPTNISAVAVSGTSIRIRWTDNSTVESGFKITNSVSTYTLSANSTSYTWSGLANGTYMCFRVWAYNAYGSSSSTPWGCTTTPTIPAAPSNVTATATSASNIRIAWSDNSSNESGFQLTNGVTTRTLSAGTTSYNWGGLAPGTYMCFRILAYNLAGSSAYAPNGPTNWWACTTTPNPPAAPSNVSATATSANSIRIAWTDNANNESGFQLTNGVTTVNVAANATSYTWGGLAPNTYMCFRLWAYNGSGNSASAPAAPVNWACTTSQATKEQKAMNWARSVLGQTHTGGDLGDSNHEWDGWCDNFVGHAYGLAASGYETALAHYNDLNGRGQIHTTGTPPSGALVFYDAAPVNDGAGHVMLSEGDGNYITTAATIQRVSLTWPGATYLGWAYANPEWPGRS